MFGKWRFRFYHKVPQEGEEGQIHEESERVLSGKSQLVQLYIAYTIIIIGMIVGITLLFSSKFLTRPLQQPQWLSCGDNPTTARERNCSFDIITFAWQTSECYDAPLVEEFAIWEPWTFWTDESGNETVSLAQARRGDVGLYFPWKYHVVHCTFVWRQMHRAYESGWIDEHSRSYHHTTHCQRMLLMDCQDEGRFCELPGDHVVTSADLIYPACERVDKSSQSVWDGF